MHIVLSSFISFNLGLSSHRSTNTKLVCAVGSRNGTEETKLLVLDFEDQQQQDQDLE